MAQAQTMIERLFENVQRLVEIIRLNLQIQNLKPLLDTSVSRLLLSAFARRVFNLTVG